MSSAHQPSPKPDAAQESAPQPDPPKPDAAQEAAPQPDPPKPDAAQEAAPQPDPPKPDAAQEAAPQPDPPQPDAAQEAVPQSTLRGFARDALSAVGIVLVLIVIPAIVVGGLVGGSATSGVIVGGLIGFLICITSGYRRALQYLPVVMFSAGLSITTNGTWLWVVGLVILAFAAGLSANKGLFVPTVLIGVLYSAVQRAPDAHNTVLAVTFCLVGTLIAVAVARLLGAPPRVDVAPMPAPQARTLAVGFAVAAGLAGAIMLVWGNQHGYWLPMTVFLLAMPRPGMGLRNRAEMRVAGTALGVVFGGLIVASPMPHAGQLLIGAICLVLALAVRDPYWASSAAVATTLVLLLTPPGGSTEVGDSRLLATVLAAVISIAIAALAQLWLRRYPPDQTEEQLADNMRSSVGDVAIPPRPGAPGRGNDS